MRWRTILEVTAIVVLLIIIGSGVVLTRYLHPARQIKSGVACRDAKDLNDGTSGSANPITIASADLAHDYDLKSRGALFEFISPATAMPSDVRPAAETFYAFIHRFDEGSKATSPTRAQAIRAARILSQYWATCKAAPPNSGGG